MSRNKRPDSVYEGIYSKFLNSPQRNRKVLWESMYRRVLTELSVNRFKWVGLPDSVDERFLEMTLYHQALSIFYWDDEFDKFMAVKGTATHPNMYDNPTRFRTHGIGQYKSKWLSPSIAVPIWSNYMRIPDHDIVMLYASKLAEVERTIEINSMSMRHTQMIFVDENERLSFSNVMRQHHEGEPYIMGTSSLDMSKIQAVQLGIDKDQVLNMQIVKQKMWNECMTLLGIKNSNQEKKERMVVDEVNANDDQVVSARGVSLNARRQACEIINTKWGTDIRVGWNEQSDAAVGDSLSMLYHIGVGD